MYRKLKLVPSPNLPMWSRRPKSQRALFSIEREPLHQAARQDVWPTDTPLTTKLYGCRQELGKEKEKKKKPTTFIIRIKKIV